MTQISIKSFLSRSNATVTADAKEDALIKDLTKDVLADFAKAKIVLNPVANRALKAGMKKAYEQGVKSVK